MKYLILLFIISMLLTRPTLAIDYEYASGIGVNLSKSRFNYSDGKTSNKTIVAPASLFTELNTNRINKIRIGWQYLNYDVDATQTDNLGVTVKGHQFETSWLKKIRFSRSFKPWIGLGIRTSLLKSTSRYTIDNDGFLASRLENISATYIAILGKVNIDWEVGDFWLIDMSATYDQPLNDGLRGFSLLSGIKYQF